MPRRLCWRFLAAIYWISLEISGVVCSEQLGTDPSDVTETRPSVGDVGGGKAPIVLSGCVARAIVFVR
jgi:hypothetical protein